MFEDAIFQNFNENYLLRKIILVSNNLHKLDWGNDT